MRYRKCLLAGVLVVAATAVISPILVLIGLAINNLFRASANNMSIGWDPFSLIKQPSISLVAFVAACFLIGFLWEYRRSGKTGR